MSDKRLPRGYFPSSHLRPPTPVGPSDEQPQQKKKPVVSTRILLAEFLDTIPTSISKAGQAFAASLVSRAPPTTTTPSNPQPCKTGSSTAAPNSASLSLPSVRSATASEPWKAAASSTPDPRASISAPPGTPTIGPPSSATTTTALPLPSTISPTLSSPPSSWPSTPAAPGTPPSPAPAGPSTPASPPSSSTRSSKSSPNPSAPKPRTAHWLRFENCSVSTSRATTPPGRPSSTGPWPPCVRPRTPPSTTTPSSISSDLIIRANLSPPSSSPA